MAKESAGGLDFSGGGAPPAVSAAYPTKAAEAAQALSTLGLFQPGNQRGAQGRGRGKPAAGGNHPSEPEKDGEVRWRRFPGVYVRKGKWHFEH